jgi:hypothetical protein
MRVWCLAACLIGMWMTPAWAAKASKSEALAANQVSRMAFKAKAGSKKAPPACQLTLMHAYTSKVNKRHTQFVFTGTVAASRAKGEGLGVSVVGENHVLAHTAQGYKSFPTTHIELGVEDSSVRRFVNKKNSCKKQQVCATYKDNSKRELQALLGTPQRNVHLLFPLAVKQPNVVIDLSQFGDTQASADTPLAQFKSCVAELK